MNDNYFYKLASIADRLSGMRKEASPNWSNFINPLLSGVNGLMDPGSWIPALGSMINPFLRNNVGQSNTTPPAAAPNTTPLYTTRSNSVGDMMNLPTNSQVTREDTSIPVSPEIPGSSSPIQKGPASPPALQPLQNLDPQPSPSPTTQPATQPKPFDTRGLTGNAASLYKQFYDDKMNQLRTSLGEEKFNKYYQSKGLSNETQRMMANAATRMASGFDPNAKYTFNDALNNHNAFKNNQMANAGNKMNNPTAPAAIPNNSSIDPAEQFRQGQKALADLVRREGFSTTPQFRAAAKQVLNPIYGNNGNSWIQHYQYGIDNNLNPYGNGAAGHFVANVNNYNTDKKHIKEYTSAVQNSPQVQQNMRINIAPTSNGNIGYNNRGALRPKQNSPR